MKRRERRAAGLAAAVWGALAAFSCAGGVVPQDNFYRLEGILRPEPLSEPALAGVLRVQRPVADPLLGSRPILWREDRPGAPLQQYHYHHWAEVPPVALQRELVACLRAARVSPQVVTPRERTPSDFELAARLERLEHLRGGGGGDRVLVGVEVSLRDLRGSELVHRARYLAEEAAEGDMETVARAFTRAIDRLCADLVVDLAGLSRRGPPQTQGGGSRAGAGPAR